MAQVTFNGKTILADELAQSRSGDSLGSEVRRWVVEGSNDADDIVGGLELIIPRSLPNGYLYNKTSYEYPSVERGDNSIWLCSAEYVATGGTRSGSVEIPVGTARLRRSTTTENVLVTQPEETQHRLTPDALPTAIAIEYQGIGDNGETFDGATVPKPTTKFSYDFTLPGASATPAFWRLCDDCVGALNSATFKGYRPASVLCTAIEGVFSTNEDTTLTFNFQYKPWQPARNFNPDTAFQISMPAHSGWAYLDFHTVTSVKTSPRRVFVEVRQIDVLMLFPTADFNDLNIPGDDLGDYEGP